MGRKQARQCKKACGEPARGPGLGLRFAAVRAACRRSRSSFAVQARAQTPVRRRMRWFVLADDGRGEGAKSNLGAGCHLRIDRVRHG